MGRVRSVARPLVFRRGHEVSAQLDIEPLWPATTASSRPAGAVAVVVVLVLALVVAIVLLALVVLPLVVVLTTHGDSRRRGRRTTVHVPMPRPSPMASVFAELTAGQGACSEPHS